MINWQPINKTIAGIYSDEGNVVVPKHNYLTGQKNYVLATLEQIIGYLNQSPINHETVKFLLSSLISVAQNGSEGYYDIINDVNNIIGIGEDIDYVMQKIKNDFAANVLTEPETIALKNLTHMNYNEYLMKNDYQNCDYKAMLVIANLTYQIINHGLDKYISEIEVFVDTNDKLLSWECKYSEEPIEIFLIEWTSK